jgi:hypothetical protein
MQPVFRYSYTGLGSSLGDTALQLIAVYSSISRSLSSSIRIRSFQSIRLPQLWEVEVKVKALIAPSLVNGESSSMAFFRKRGHQYCRLVSIHIIKFWMSVVRLRRLYRLKTWGILSVATFKLVRQAYFSSSIGVDEYVCLVCDVEKILQFAASIDIVSCLLIENQLP